MNMRTSPRTVTKFEHRQPMNYRNTTSSIARITRLIVLSVCAFGCGQTGDLRLPDAPEKEAPTHGKHAGSTQVSNQENTQKSTQEKPLGDTQKTHEQSTAPVSEKK